MTRYLCISVTLLDDLFHGKRDRDEPEWPPSPMRLFQALVAGSRAGCRNADWTEAKAKAFRWLERRDPPTIVAPEARRAAAYTIFVPNNDSDKKFDRQDRLTSKLVRPYRITRGPADAAVGHTLHYLWAISEDEWPEARPHAELICSAARHLFALGWGLDQAVAHGRLLKANEAAALSGRRWRPWRTGGPGLRHRVPTDGSLQDLEVTYESFVKRIDRNRFTPPQRLRQFQSVVYLSGHALPPRPFAVFELPEGVAFRQEDAVAVAAMVRSLTCRCAKQDSHQFPGGPESYVAGHGPRRGDGRFVDESWARFSYLPLPSIGHQHADGMIRRVMIAEPFGGDGSHAKWAQQVLRNQVLLDHNGNERGVLLERWRKSSNRMIDLYVGEARAWCTVTPVVLPGFDDGKRWKADRLFLQAVQQAGFPLQAISDFTLRKAPFWKGLHPDRYRRPDYLDSARGRRFSAWHVQVSFYEPMSGPIAIGAARHIGLGLFAVVDDAQRERPADAPTRGR